MKTARTAEQLAVLARVEETFAARAKAHKRLALSKRPESIAAARKAVQEADAAYRAADAARSLAFSKPDAPRINKPKAKAKTDWRITRHDNPALGTPNAPLATCAGVGDRPSEVTDGRLGIGRCPVCELEVQLMKADRYFAGKDA